MTIPPHSPYRHKRLKPEDKGVKLPEEFFSPVNLLLYTGILFFCVSLTFYLSIYFSPRDKIIITAGGQEISAINPNREEERQGEQNSPSWREAEENWVSEASPFLTEKIDINTASSEELKKLPSIGDKIAEQIVQYRADHGFFNSIEEIQKVKGIKKGTFNKIKNYIKI